MCAIEKITSKTIKIRYPDPEDSGNELVKEVKMYVNLNNLIIKCEIFIKKQSDFNFYPLERKKGRLA